MKKLLLVTLLILLLVITIGIFWVKNANNFKREGTFKITVNNAPIEIIRDQNGIAYILAENKPDAIRGQAFVTAQDRLFQIEFYRALIKGEAAQYVGASMLPSDIKMRVLDLYGNAERSFQYLDEETKHVLQWYCEGFNEYLKVGTGELPLELSLLDMEPKPLKPVDIVSITHFIGYFHSKNMEDEVLSLNLAATMKDATALLPLTINLDRTKPLKRDTTTYIANPVSTKQNASIKSLPAPLLPYPKLGSNNWAISGKKSQAGKPILANDPHVDARVLPGLFYPLGITCPEFKAVGISTPGIPGILCGRNEFVSFGVTNAYGDSQDLFIEKTEGDFYIQNGKKVPVKKRKEIFLVKDSTTVELEIRATERGPIISDFPIFNILTNDVVSLRWSLAETRSTSIGIDRFLETKNVTSFRKALEGVDNMFFNFVFADTNGNIAHQATGLVPVRANGNGTVPQMGNLENAWKGFIPKNELPHMINPERGWVGTANHDTRPDDYPYYYSSHFSPYYRYMRIKEFFSNNKQLKANDLWELIFDVKNMQAQKLVPLFVEALSADQQTTELAEILKTWNREDDINQVGASVYTVLYNELLYLILNDELPDNIEDQYWENVYYWNQRLDSMMLSSHYFIDNINTPKKETLPDLIVQAGITTENILKERLGENKKNWAWGKLHTVYFYSPIKKEGFGSEFLGAELLPKQGSNQTLNRGAFKKNKDHTYETNWFSSFRMVADMNDHEKIMGVLSGGSAARVLHPYHKSQLEQWKTGEWIPYWISKDKIKEHARFKLILE